MVCFLLIKLVGQLNDRFFKDENLIGLAKQYECRFSLANGMNFDEQLGIWKDKQRKQQQAMQ
jgi:hypothetical protein